MKSKLFFLFVFLFFFAPLKEIKAQNFIRKSERKEIRYAKSEIYQRKNLPSTFEFLSLDIEGLKSFLNTNAKNSDKVLQLPTINGDFSNFRIKEDSNFEAQLSKKYAMIKSYSAQGIEDPSAIAKISIGTDGFHAIIFSGTGKTVYIDPYTKDQKTLISYQRSEVAFQEDDFTCQVESFTKTKKNLLQKVENANDGVLRTFRLALTCSGEYAQFHLTNQNIASSATDADKKAAVLSAMNTTITRVNGVYERDLAVKMVLVANNDEIIFLDANTDNITDGNPNAMIDEVQTICDTKIGNANYDIGHIFSIGGDGLAGGGVVCVTGSKAKGVTGRSEPIGDPYDIDYVAHEIGHQFGANHTQNNDCNRNNSTAVEPGSASTIMGYAGICAPNVQNKSDDYFHAVSIAEMWNTIQSSATCAATTSTNNAAPVANAGTDFSIPKSTPFILKGTATDTDGTASLTYNWEQIDNETATMAPLSNNTGGPMFRSLPSKTVPERYMPDLATVIAGNTATTWEVLPSVARDLNFSFLVRDNHAGGGSTARDDVKITVVDANAFTVSSPSTAVTWDVGTTQTITWNKGTTDTAPINCLNVTIKLSLDGGVTFPITLKEDTPNDGSESIVIPNNPTTSARIMVMAADNIFYNVNATNFTINSTAPAFVLTSTSGTQNVCNSGNQSASYVLNIDFINGLSENVSFTTSGAPSGATISFNPTTINADGNVTMQVAGLDGANPQPYTITVTGTSTSVNQNLEIPLNVFTLNFSEVALTSPANEATDIALTTELNWEADTNVTSYDVEVATDNDFSTIISNENVATNSYSLEGLSGTTTYYWRVKPKNNCGEGSFSTAFSFTTLEPSYCVSTFTDEAGGSEYIKNVSFNTIDNDSENDTVDGYEDFTSISTGVKRGESHQISVTIDAAGYQDRIYVFIDWNQNYEFDTTTEKYDLGLVQGKIGTKEFNIIVPQDAKYGNTRMRVLIEYEDPDDGSGEGACDSNHLTEWGETEDYTITVINPFLINDAVFEEFNLYPNTTRGEVTLNLKTISTEEVFIQLFNIRGERIYEQKFLNVDERFSEKIRFPSVSTGLYFLRITNGGKYTVKKLTFLR